MKILYFSFSIFLSKNKIYYHMSLFSIPIMIIILKNISFNSISLNNHLMMYDNLSMMMVILSLMSVTLIILSSSSIMKIYSTIYPIMMILLLTFLFSNMFYFYLMFETVLIPTMILIMKLGKQPERLQASIYLIIYTILASLPLLLCILMMKNNFSFYFSFMMMFNFKWTIFLILAFLVKMPMFMFHLWLPKAHVEAPLEGSMILAAILLKLGGYGIIRMLPICNLNFKTLKLWIIMISIIGASMTSMNCIRQKDMKALIAYSSVAHMGLTLSSIITFSNMGINGAIMMMIAHGLSSSALFFLVNDLYMKIHSRNIILLKGIISISPNITFWWFIFMAINMSAPPSINTLSEIMIMSSILLWSFFMIIPMMITSLTTASFSLSLYVNISHNKNEMFFFKNSNTKTYMSLFMHLIPLIMMLMKPEMMTMN